MKKCIVCNFQKPIKKEDDSKKLCVNCIHEYNYSCYECLDNMAKQKEKELRDIYDKMVLVGIIPE
jgi:glycosylphosphatidylinositol transamidase (GPIT) subunit GPI8